MFGKVLCDCAAKNDKIAAITAAMADGTGLKRFARRYPDRFFDVGIAEEHAVTFAAGLAAGGLKPVFAVYSSFLQRGYDQIIHDVALQNLPVVFAVDRAGLVGSNGNWPICSALRFVTTDLSRSGIPEAQPWISTRNTGRLWNMEKVK